MTERRRNSAGLADWLTAAHRRVFLVTGGASFETSGAEAALEPLLAGRAMARFPVSRSLPTLDLVEAGLAACRRHRPDLIVAVGGGSVLDTAKAIRVLVAQTPSPRSVVLATPRRLATGRPLVAIPTTAGSGAEATAFAVIYVDGRKQSLAHPSVRPDLAVLDSRLTHSLPPAVTATSGFDAVSHAIESFWSIRSTGRSRNHSRRALRELLPNLPAAVSRPTPANRRALLEGAHEAGQAINLAQTTAGHGLSYGLTARYGLPHGAAVALVLPGLLDVNAQVGVDDCQDRRGLPFVQQRLDELCRLLGAADPATARARLEDLVQVVGLATRQAVEQPPAALDQLLADANPARLNNNPRRLTSDVQRDLLAAALVPAQVAPQGTSSGTCRPRP